MVEGGHSSDVYDAVIEDNQAIHGGLTNIVEEMDLQKEADMTTQACKVDKVFQSSGADVEVSSSTPIERVSDATSVRSLPIAQVSESSSPVVGRPVTSRGTDSRSSAMDGSDGSGSRYLHPTRTPSTNHDRRRSTHVDNRVTNRFSGFFSNLMHRRDALPTTQARQTVRDDGRSESPPTCPDHPPCSSSPVVPPRPVTPPPALPPPTLHELGLTMSEVTPVLSPSHFSSPPASGAYLSPHYLLLCHSQGLDVLPLVSPPAPVPYALVRRVPFKHVVVMEQRGVLVAIAGRRDGVRVYALDEVRKAVEWRIDVEVRRERDRTRREEAKRMASGPIDDSGSELRGSEHNYQTASAGTRSKLSRKPSHASTNAPSSLTVATKSKSPPLPSTQPSQPRTQLDDPPPYSQAEVRARSNSTVSAQQFVQHSPTISSDGIHRNLMGPQPTSLETSPEQNSGFKSDWPDSRDSSDEEAIDIVAAGVSGSQALDERTSAMANVSSSLGTHTNTPQLRTQTSQTSHSSRWRPANLELSLTRVNVRNALAPQGPPSPTPTLLTLRQALQALPSGVGGSHAEGTRAEAEPGTPDGEEDDFEVLRTPTDNITLTQALMESRLPDLPPIGTRRPQQPILISSHPIVTGEEELSSPRTSESTATRYNADNGQLARRRRRRWSVLEGFFQGGSDPPPPLPRTSESNLDESTTQTPSSPISNELTQFHPWSRRPPAPTSTPRIRPSISTSQDVVRPSISGTVPSHPVAPSESSTTPVRPRSRSRFVPRILTNVLYSRRDSSSTSRVLDSDKTKIITTPIQHPAPAPKLEYVKLPGTKGAIIVKAVETAKKSFLAILCGDRGEKVELFAGTYRTALGLSRTFILPDSPRSLELQLQGDDLVEVFLVFSQNVFGLEPATVRVREVRIGRAERRAARRRARDRETLLDDPTATADPESGPIEDEANITVSVSMTTAEGGAENDASEPAHSVSRTQQGDQQQSDGVTNGVQATSEELAALATAQMSPYTTFQQLSFSPNFPLASIADEYIIPPTYKSFMEYRVLYESASGSDSCQGTSQHQLSPPGLPPPIPLPPSKWFYRDPKGVVQGPWKAELMQSWYKDGLLPPDLPVRREEDTNYIILKHLRLQCVDPTQPFGSPLPQIIEPVAPTDDRPLLKPISLLAQPRHFGPPALFFSSRGGHSTTIVDARGRLVLKGRFLWSADNEDGKISVSGSPNCRMGDVKRLESIDVSDRSILIAMRQGGLEAVDLMDALLRPADGSRTLFPHFNPPSSSFNRRDPFVWRMGTPISSGSTSDDVGALKPSASRGTLKKGTSPGKTGGRQELSLSGDVDGDHAIQDEILFLGRKDDALYLCERNSGSFRILRLCPSVS